MAEPAYTVYLRYLIYLGIITTMAQQVEWDPHNMEYYMARFPVQTEYDPLHQEYYQFY